MGDLTWMMIDADGLHACQSISHISVVLCMFTSPILSDVLLISTQISCLLRFAMCDFDLKFSV